MLLLVHLVGAMTIAARGGQLRDHPVAAEQTLLLNSGESSSRDVGHAYLKHANTVALSTENFKF